MVSDRLHVLDILRGFAILGMFIVHFDDNASGGGPIGAIIQKAILWFVTEKSFATFAILFGVSFAIQLYKADARGEDVRWRFLRRLLGVLSFGVLARALSPATTLTTYAISGVWLLFVRRWSKRALLVALLVSMTLNAMWNLAVGSYQWATVGLERANAEYQSPRPNSSRLAARQELRAAEPDTSFLRLAKARVVDLYWTKTDLWGDWPRGSMGVLLGSLSSYPFMFFLIGLLAVHLGVFEHPTGHRRLLLNVMVIGAVFWAVDQSQLYKTLWPTTWVIPAVRLARTVQFWFVFGQPPGWGLALTYIGALTLLVAFSKRLERRFTAIFGTVGRMALTNYVLQFPVLAVLFDNYAFGVKSLSPLLALLVAVILFSVLVIFSRWWLARFRLGPAEWVLRSITYGRLQPLRLTVDKKSRLSSLFPRDD